MIISQETMFATNLNLFLQTTLLNTHKPISDASDTRQMTAMLPNATEGNNYEVRFKIKAGAFSGHAKWYKSERTNQTSREKHRSESVQSFTFLAKLYQESSLKKEAKEGISKLSQGVTKNTYVTVSDLERLYELIKPFHRTTN